MSDLTIGILDVGPVVEPLKSTYGTYPMMMERLLAGRGFRFQTYVVREGVFPPGVDAADGWLITGSRFGAYDDQPWIPPLEDFLRGAFAARIPIVGICFGHQILAQALGGKVEKFKGGWAIGRQQYQLDGFDRPLEVIGLHQDQVIEAPEGAEISGSSPFCKIAALTYGDQAWTLQPHPEFEPDFFRDLMEVRRTILPADLVAEAEKTLDGSYDSQLVADKIENVLKARQRAETPTAIAS
ncbi:type 1 glutamine amidotransferase [Rhodobacteraceae bacterium NNCM2]|nr:type 1 glutamine amidotransferase [Coraliihabitans acroporae]